MGTHQIMMVILVVVLVGVAIALALFLFGIHAANTNRQLVINDMNFLAAEAFRFWRTPRFMGGGAPKIGPQDQEKLQFFLHWDGNEKHTASGTYTININEDGSIIIYGTGTEIGNDRENPVQASVIIKPDSNYAIEADIIN